MPSCETTAECVVRTLEEFVSAVRSFMESVNGQPLWFRGQRDDSWKLAPGILRSPYVKKARQHEGNMTELFQGHAPAYCERPPLAWLDWQVLMQHHGCPTRLLDWSEGALIALYFAVRRLGKGVDTNSGSVFVLDPHKLSASGPFAGITPLSGATVRNKALDTEKPDSIVPFLPTYLNARSLAQKSRFTLSPFDPDALQNLKRPVLFRIEIAHEAKARLFWQLKECGITDTTLFPDLDALARELRCHLTRGEDIA